jgi:hypothetical protein
MLSEFHRDLCIAVVFGGGALAPAEAVFDASRATRESPELR